MLDMQELIYSGWSLGGLVALEMAHLLRDDPDITVTGLLLVDTVYPKATVPVDSVARVRDHFVPPPDINASLHLKLQEVFRNSRRMINEWQPPSWKPVPGEATTEAHVFTPTTGYSAESDGLRTDTGPT
jgi:thioesterase domain-containing protein